MAGETLFMELSYSVVSAMEGEKKALRKYCQTIRSVFDADVGILLRQGWMDCAILFTQPRGAYHDPEISLRDQS